MISNRVKRNICLTLAVVSALNFVDRLIGLAVGTAEWWQPVSAAAITAVFFKFYMTYRREVKRGNLFGRAKEIG